MQFNATPVGAQFGKGPAAVQFAEGPADKSHLDGNWRRIDVAGTEILPDTAEVQGDRCNGCMVDIVSLNVDTVAPREKGRIGFDVFYQRIHLFCTVIERYGFVDDRHQALRF